MQSYEVKRLPDRPIAVRVPPSKSILNRALLLAAFSRGETVLSGCAGYGGDTEDVLGCLRALGIPVLKRSDDTLLVRGGNFSRCAELDVGSAGTAARFLTAILAFLGGDYTLRASAQMSARPMQITEPLAQAGVSFTFGEREGRLPFRMRSEGISVRELTVDTAVSTQYASGLMLAAALSAPLRLNLTGPRADGSYLDMTASVLRAFGATVQRRGNTVDVAPAAASPARFEVPADLSCASYFLATALFGRSVVILGASEDRTQPDARFLDVLREKGVRLRRTREGLAAEGVTSFTGFDLDVGDFSDQALTLAALAPFATSDTHLKNIGHIRRQECDRIEAAIRNLTALGVPCCATEGDLFIRPAPVAVPAKIKTFGDHRVAMAFSLVGMKAGGLVLDDADCCRKTFPSFFNILNDLTA